VANKQPTARISTSETAFFKQSAKSSSHPPVARAVRWRSLGIVTFLLALWCCATLLMPLPANAQASSAANPGEAAYSTLADLLENPQTRSKLIEQLRALAANQNGAGPASQDSATSQASDGSSAAANSPQDSPPSLLSALPGASLATKLFQTPQSRNTPQPAPANAAPDNTSNTQAGTTATETTRSPQASGAGTAREDASSSAPGQPGIGSPLVANLPREIARQAQAFLAGLVAGGQIAANTLQDLAQGNVGTLGSHHNRTRDLLHLAAVMALTIALFIVLRRMVRPVFGRMDAWVQAGASGPDGHHHLHRLYRHTVAMLGALLVDVAVILACTMAGYTLAALATGPRGDLGDFELAFINAFLAVEIARAVVRTFFASRFEHLRLLPVSSRTAHYWSSWLERIAWAIGYSVMLLVPVLGALMTPELGRLAGLVIALAVYVYGIHTIWSHRRSVSEGLRTRASASHKVAGTLLRVLAKLWHVLAIAYFTVLLVISQVDPNEALSFVSFATLQTLLAIGAGVLVSAVLSTLLARRIQLPADVRSRLPMLEARVNAYVPAALRWLRLIILIIVALVVLDAWQLFSIAQWMRSEAGSLVVATLVRVSIVIAFAALVWTVVASIIEHRLSLDASSQQAAPSARERTLLSLFRNAALILIVTMTILIVLSQIGINIGPLIAGAGVVGLAIGFGAQKLVQDVINGIFIQLENGMNQNDVVEVGGVFGTVEKITIRSVGIRTLDGGYHMIPFSSVDKVANHMRDFSYHLGEYTLAYRESVDDVVFHLERAFDELMTDPVLSPEVLEDMIVAGVTALNERGFTVRIMIKTKPGMQWAVQRGFNRLVKKHFNAAGIELPYPHTVVYFGQDKNGDAPPMRVRKGTAGTPAAGQAMPAGHTPRPLTPPDHTNARDVLGNELATVVDDEGNVSSTPGTQAERPKNDDQRQ
jgi:small-conductance mechanosensitive channel